MADDQAPRENKRPFGLGRRHDADPAPAVHWVEETWTALQPFATGGAYVNFLGDEGEARVRAAYSPRTYERLAALKTRYDPTNFFRLNNNIPPNG